MSYRCSYRSCPVTGKLENFGRSVEGVYGANFSYKGNHTHLPEPGIAAKRKLYDVCKERAETDPTTDLREIFDQEVQRYL